MPPKRPDDGLPVSPDDIKAALSDIDERIASFQQLRADWIARAAAPSSNPENAAVNSSHTNAANVAFLGPLSTYSHDAALQLSLIHI